MTTMILPSKSLRFRSLTHRHSPSQIPLGDEFIENEMEAMKIEPTEDYGSGSHLTATDPLA